MTNSDRKSANESSEKVDIRPRKRLKKYMDSLLRDDGEIPEERRREYLGEWSDGDED